jgi:hypothetical protein
MPVADAPLPFSVVPPAATLPVPAPPVPSVVAAGSPPVAPPLPTEQAPWNLPRGPRPDGLDRDTGRLLAAAFGIAWLLCPTLEPMPEHVPDYPLWQLPIDVAAVVSIVVAVVVLWRGGRNGALLGAAAGALMAVETMICPIAGHTPVGWWTWTQTGLSLFVLGTSAALMAGMGRRPTGPPPA